ncbi:hypothetical protein BGX23_010083 [Mortierella sp. AD031]|nr:hypothetical protein BGX23_010083 [Mortierella sp. AD031]
MSDVVFECLLHRDLAPMAAAFFNRHKTRADVTGTAITTTGEDVSPSEIPLIVHEVMSEVGIVGLSGIINPRNHSLESRGVVRLERFVLMEYGDEMGIYDFSNDFKADLWIFVEPKDFSVEETRVVRDEVEQQVKDLIADYGY